MNKLVNVNKEREVTEMNELTNINENKGLSLINIDCDNDRLTILGRDLHRILGVNTAYKDWFPRMAEYGFTEGVDFNPLNFERVQKEGTREVKRTLIDHQLTIEMAKEICMLQRNERGKQARQYFINLEKMWNSPEMVKNRALKMMDMEITQLRGDVTQLALRVEELEPKAEYYDELMDINDECLMSIRNTAKALKIRERIFIKMLIDNKYLFRDNLNRLVPYADKRERGDFVVKEGLSKKGKHMIQTYTTPKGRDRIRKLVKRKRDFYEKEVI